MSVFSEKIKEVLFAVLPIALIVIILNFTIAPVEFYLVVRFLIGALLIILGLSVFLLGVDIGITPIGNLIGARLVKINNIRIISIMGVLLGFFISVAEPDLHILAQQAHSASGGIISKLSILIVVSVGIGLLLSLGLVRIVYNIPMYKALLIIYMIILGLGIFTSREFLAISFDASGATTGALTVPFILALALGVSHLKKDSRASEKDSFGLVGIASSGAIMAVMVMSIISQTDKITGTVENSTHNNVSLIAPFISEFPKLSKESVLALFPLLIIFLLFNAFSFKLKKSEFYRIIKGLVYTLIGLVLFLVGVNAGFMDMGSAIGYKLASFNNKSLLIIVGFILGLVTVLAEPAVYVLTHQIEDVTSGYVKKRIVLFALSIGIGISVMLSMIRILVPGIQLWHYLLPGYIIAIALMFVVPDLFIGIAFDSGGVASGPMTATFILAFAQGAADAIESADVLADAFGIIAMVALTPLITLQILGFIFKIKSVKGGLDKND